MQPTERAVPLRMQDSPSRQSRHFKLFHLLSTLLRMIRRYVMLRYIIFYYKDAKNRKIQ